MEHLQHINVAVDVLPFYRFCLVAGISLLCHMLEGVHLSPLFVNQVVKYLMSASSRCVWATVLTHSVQLSSVQLFTAVCGKSCSCQTITCCTCVNSYRFSLIAVNELMTNSSSHVSNELHDSVILWRALVKLDWLQTYWYWITNWQIFSLF